MGFREICRISVGIRRAGLALAFAGLCTGAAQAQIGPKTTCDRAGIGSVALSADAPVTIQDVSTGTAGTGANAVPYCLVKVLVPEAIHIWVALPTGGKWNGRFRSEGGGGYAGSVGVATDSVLNGYAGAMTDTGHVGGSGTFGMAFPGMTNVPLQIDFAYRSEHLMAVIGKQLVQAFYGQPASYSYWYGCSTGGRQGLRMAQDFPTDYNGILAGAPAIHWDRFQAYQIWPQMVMYRDTGGPISTAKLNLATSAAIAACDANDGIVDGVIDDPRTCRYNPAADSSITKSSCSSTDNTCLTPAEAGAIQKIWNGARNTRGKLLWYSLERGAPLTGLAGATPFSIAVAQPRYWVFLDPTWDWQTLNYSNYETFFNQTVYTVGPIMASDNPNLRPFRDAGGKVIMYHGWADPLIMPEGTIDYLNAVTVEMGGGYDQTNQFMRLFMAPGMGHCSGGAGPNAFGNSGTTGNTPPLTPDPQHDIFKALVGWVEQGRPPETIIATKYVNDNVVNGVLRTRPLCLYPKVARYTGKGDPNDAANYVCAEPAP